MPEEMSGGDGKINIKGARVHNLKNINLSIDRDKFIVITGLSGSGKSSLAIDTLYAEGQRRYVESLSSYARQFLGRINKPDVDFINGIPPAIAIEQKVIAHNPRSTVGTSTEIYDYLKLLYARIGKTISPVSGNEVKKHNEEDIIKFAFSFRENSEVLILAPAESQSKKIKQFLTSRLQQGFTRILINNKIVRIQDALESINDLSLTDNKIELIIDRVIITDDEETRSRIAGSVESAFYEGKGRCIVEVNDNGTVTREYFSSLFEADGMEFEEPSTHMFSFNTPVGACPDCDGYGSVIGIDEDLVVPDKSLSVYNDAIACWRGDKMKKWKEKLIYNSDKFDFPVHKPYYELSRDFRDLLWKGNRYFYGLNRFFKHLKSKSYKIQYRVMLSRYRGKTICHECNGTRLKKECAFVYVAGKTIQELILMPISDLQIFFNRIKLDDHEIEISGRILQEIRSRLSFLNKVGVGYLNLNRSSSTLSGGESQRVRLATNLGSNLVGSLYILDEPSIGLHPRDTRLLIGVLQNLRDQGNTVIVVEHDEDIIRASDQIIDIGPLAGRLGGEVVFQGNHDELLFNKNSLTAKYLTGEMNIEIPESRGKWNNYIEITAASNNNLKFINVKFPLNIMTVVTGVSGSGKSSLVKGVLYPALKKHFESTPVIAGQFGLLRGDINSVRGVEMIDQNPIGRSTRSNPATYIKIWDEIRKLFAGQKSAINRNLNAGHFSFNTVGGRCEECQGEGTIKVEMQFMADVNLICEKCNGSRFKEDVLKVRYHEKNIHEILELTVREAIDFFGQDIHNIEKKIIEKLKHLDDVGLDYVKLGQSSSTLSGGESQRVKLASFLGREKGDQSTLFIFDEPTTGLHFHDINKLLASFRALIDRGNSIVVVEHNLEVIKSGDWIIDLGPDGGEKGGEIVFQGTPEDMVMYSTSFTGRFLAQKFNQISGNLNEN